MAVDNKYGKVTTERGSIGEEEPVVVFRAQDILLVNVLNFYREECKKAGSPQHHLDLIDSTLNKVEEWQENNPVRIPQSNGFDFQEYEAP